MSDVQQEKINRAGDVKIEQVSIINSKGVLVNITPQVVGIEIFEDLFDSFITGTVIVRDAQNISAVLPLVGEEQVQIDVITPSLPDKDGIKGSFYIYKMADRLQLAERETGYVLHFISREAIIDLNKKISKVYAGKVSSIVSEILTSNIGLETTKQLNIEETQNSIKYISNFWSPVRNLQYVSESAVSLNGSPSYVFFENKYGLNFVSLESLYEHSPLQQKFIWNSDGEAVSTNINIAKDYQNILQIETYDTFDYMERLKSGFYGSELITYDLMTKQYSHKSYKPNFAEHNHLNSFPLWSNSTVSNTRTLIQVQSKYYNNFDGYGDVTNTSTAQARVALMAQAEAYKIGITVHGRTDYSVGQKIYLEIPKATQITKDDMEWEDKMQSGNYLIAAIRHSITRARHECVMELVKDSILIDVNA